ncbi:MAG: aminoacyl-tRNA hydrolase [Planctomycetota bacterium]|nr:MAG: aminoacyl-tRNA hydrolase [Planctomycetota bacterium]
MACSKISAKRVAADAASALMMSVINPPPTLGKNLTCHSSCHGYAPQQWWLGQHHWPPAGTTTIFLPRQDAACLLVTWGLHDAMKIIVGIGNPGAEYAATRHNIGWMILDRLPRQEADFQRSKWPLTLSTWLHPQAGKVLLVKPQTYVNRSGAAAGALAAFYKIAPEDMLVISDDIHLPLGTLRLRAQGSHGGHNGLRHIIQCLGQAFPRLRVGIDSPADPNAQVDHVLGRFGAEELADVQLAITKAQACIDTWLGEGVAAAMRHNGPLHPPQPKASEQSKTDDDAVNSPSQSAHDTPPSQDN